MNAAPLPRNDLVDELMKSFFRPSFIEVTDTANFNNRKTVPFRKNDDLQTSTIFHPSNTVVNASKDLAEQDAVWVCQLTAGYQFSHEEDRDPNEELPTEGGTRRFEDYDHSTVFVEACRDWYDHSFRLVAEGGNPEIGNDARVDLKDFISATAAHEMGHHPGGSTVDEEHAEGGLMRGGGANKDYPKTEKFSFKTILRFREAHHWSKK